MAYSNVWSDTVPTGSEAANTIDNIFRGLKVDIEQRLQDIFGTMPSFTTDPLRPYGLKFTDAQDSVINLGDNAGTPRSLIVKDKASANSYLTVSSVAITATVPFAVTSATISTGSAGESRLTIGSTVASVFSDIVFKTDSTKYSWLIGAQVTTNNGFEITPSTAVGGSTFTTPVFKIMQSGVATIPGRLVVGTDIATSVAYAVFGDATALEPTWGFTPIANVLGIVSSVSNSQATGTYLHAHVQTKQTVATTGTIQGLETWTWTSHTSGTVVGVFGLLGNCAVSGVGGITSNVVCVTGGVVVSGGTVTQVKGVNSGSTVDGASSIVTNMYGLYSKSPIVSNSGTITNNYGLYIENMNAGTTINYAIKTNGGKVNFLSLPTSSAGLSTGDVWLNANVLTIIP